MNCASPFLRTSILSNIDGERYRPIWHHPATSTFNPIVADINIDGVNALLFNSNNALTVFETSVASRSQVGHPLSVPWGITAKPVGENSVLLSWQAAGESVTYTLYRGERKDSLKQIREGIQETAFTDTGLARRGKLIGTRLRRGIQTINFQGGPPWYLLCRRGRPEVTCR